MKTLPKAEPQATAEANVKLCKKSVHIRLDSVLHQQAAQLARADKRSFSQYVELALEQYLREQQTLAKYFQPGREDL